MGQLRRERVQRQSMLTMKSLGPAQSIVMRLVLVQCVLLMLHHAQLAAYSSGLVSQHLFLVGFIDFASTALGLGPILDTAQASMPPLLAQPLLLHYLQSSASDPCCAAAKVFCTFHCTLPCTRQHHCAVWRATSASQVTGGYSKTHTLPQAPPERTGFRAVWSSA